MTRIEIRRGNLIVHIDGFDKILSLRSTITVPLAHVCGTVVRPAVSGPPEDGFFTGTYQPGSLVAGTYRFPDGEGLVFWDVRDVSHALSIELKHDRFVRLVVEVSDESPDSAAQRIAEALRVEATV